MAEEVMDVEMPTELEWIPQIPFEYSFQALRLCNWGAMHPYEFEGWRKESRSWKETCYIHAGLSIAIITSLLQGPDATRLLSENSISDFTKMKPYRGRHVVFCAENGNIIQDGIVVKLDENTYRCYDLAPYLEYLAQSGDYDVTVTDISREMFIFQLGGPRSLEIIEHAAKMDNHDQAFMQLKDVRIAGHDVQVLRMGMCGTLGYEVHGPIEAAHDVYNALIEAGEQFGLVKLGTLVYVSSHAEAGIAQQPSHFTEAWADDEGFKAWCYDNVDVWWSPLAVHPTGTYTTNVADTYRNPFEVGWGKMVNFNHDFKGKQALEKIRDSKHDVLVTLYWNKDDVVDVMRSQIEDEEPYMSIEYPVNYDDFGLMADQIPVMRVETPDGKPVGASMWRIYSEYYKTHISEGIIDPDYAAEGTELVVVYGQADGRQKKMRVTVGRTPLIDLPMNKDYPIDQIPHYEG